MRLWVRWGTVIAPARSNMHTQQIPTASNIQEAVDNAGAAYVTLNERAVVLSQLFELLADGATDSSNAARVSGREEPFWRGIHSMIQEISDAADTMNATLDLILSVTLRQRHDGRESFLV